MITPTQCRMARAALGWSGTKLAKAAGVGLTTINRFEIKRGKPYPANMEAIQRALEEAGVIFLADGEMTDGGIGVRFRQGTGEPKRPAITPAQCREARTLLGWSRDQLVARSGVPFASLGKFERGAIPLYAEAHTAIKDALEAAGVEFTSAGEPGVKLRK